MGPPGGLALQAKPARLLDACLYVCFSGSAGHHDSIGWSICGPHFDPCSIGGLYDRMSSNDSKRTDFANGLFSSVSLNNPEVKKRILQLGLVYALMIFTMSLIASMVIDFQALLPFITNDKPITSEVMQQLYYSLMIGGILYIPVAMLMWFAPVLVAWADMPPSKALFASWMACWTNKGAFFYYITIWSVVLIVIPLTLGMIMDIIGLSRYASFVVAPFSMAALTVMYCSFFATWKGCFTGNDYEQLPN